MAKNDDGFYHTLRLSRRNPTHIKIHQILADLDKSVYKSQNQFIADAVEYYINALENDFITNDDREKREEIAILFTTHIDCFIEKYATERP